MSPANPFYYYTFGDLFDTVLPDFVLAFTFFTAIIYAVLGKRFGEQRPAVAMSAALGMALSVGLVWWEYQNDLSIVNLGPIAVGFAIIILGGVIYQSIQGVGGSWAGAGIALGACLLVGRILELDWPIDWEVVQAITVVALTVGILAFLLHHKHDLLCTQPGWREVTSARHDMGDLYQDRRVVKGLTRGLRYLRREAKDLRKHPEERPEEASDIMTQLRRILPAEGWLTERMARLREKAHFVRKGHIARIAEIQEHISQLSPETKKKAARELADRYLELKLDQRLERLDKAVAENELRIRNLTQQAQVDLQANNYPALSNVLNAASKLQRHNAHLFKIIDRTEAKLLAAAKDAARQSTGVKDA